MNRAPIFIETPDALWHLADTLAREPLVAVDTESNGLHVYQERVCLVQLSTRTDDYIIDPLRVVDLTPLAAMFANPYIEKVFHAADYDLLCLRREYNIVVQHLFDTSLAARLAGHDALGLDKMLRYYFGVDADKRHQKDDWGVRPLSDEALYYAQMDTHYLPQLRDMLLDTLRQQDRLAVAAEVFDELEADVEVPPSHDPEGYWDIGRPRRLGPRAMAVLRELYLLRDSIARDQDMPLLRVMGNRTLLDIAAHQPRSIAELSSLPEVNHYVVRRYGGRLLSAVERGLAADLPVPPPLPNVPDAHATQRFTLLQQWRKELAARTGIPAEFVMSKAGLWAIARHMPHDPADVQQAARYGPWRMAHFGPDLLTFLAQMR